MSFAVIASARHANACIRTKRKRSNPEPNLTTTQNGSTKPPPMKPSWPGSTGPSMPFFDLFQVSPESEFTPIGIKM
jgi:hypothetical protein